MLLYFAYILNVGGDFMMSRFFIAPLVIAIAVLARTEWLRTPKIARMAAGLAITLVYSLRGSQPYWAVTDLVREQLGARTLHKGTSR